MLPARRILHTLLSHEVGLGKGHWKVILPIINKEHFYLFLFCYIGEHVFKIFQCICE